MLRIKEKTGRIFRNNKGNRNTCRLGQYLSLGKLITSLSVAISFQTVITIIIFS